ncbi:MAG TPA: hypothetical protein VJQ52_05820 [Steroidobacteraceae bacterium]|nr:hypothetical protein [Steroidobacteraceae bacterium]
MTQHSEERLATEGAPSVRSGARILPFERPQSELQRAIQQRAQEAIDLDRERDRETRRPQPLKWLAIFALACIPVVLTFGAVDAFVRVFHKVTEVYSSQSKSQPQQQPVAPVMEEPASQPGVVILQPYDAAPGAQSGAAPAEQSKAPAERR